MSQSEIEQETPKRTMGRPPKPIDWAVVDELVMVGCTGTECAAYFDMHHQTFLDKVQKEYNLTFTEFAAERHEKGKSILRHKQYEKALEKDNTMLIWLGKQWLDQSEKRESLSAAAAANLLQINEKSKDLVNDKS